MHRNFLPKDKFQELINVLSSRGYRLVGPQVRDGAIIYDKFSDVSQLTYNIRDEQQPGQYRLHESDNKHFFSWANGPQALKPLTFAPKETLWTANKIANGELHFTEAQPEVTATAVLGVRACDLAALAIHDQHFLDSDYRDSYFKKRSEKLLLIAVNCTHPAHTCFCASTKDGPRAKAGFDIVLTELPDGFVVQAGSPIGEDICQQLPCIALTQEQSDHEESLVRNAAEQQARHLPAKNWQRLLPRMANSDLWKDIGQRCLSCGNCTAVCPTCFCHSESEEASLESTNTVHFRQWDSCFNHDHSYIHGIVIRPDASSKYRQWLTHKFSSWIDQFGRSGCVGCGRCISWCPVGIDVTQELQRFSEAE